MIEILRYILIGLSVIAGLNVLRNPLKVWPNTIAAVSYFAGAAGSLFLSSWWPILGGWIVSLSFQGLLVVLMGRGVFNRQINIERERNGLALFPEAPLVMQDLERGDKEAALERIARSQERQREDYKAATGIDLKDVVPTIGEEISWKDIHLQVFKVLEFDRIDTRIGPNDEVQATSMFTPYGYLLAQSPILNQPVRLPIIHRDDFLLAASVFDDPNLVSFVESDELLVTYAPRKILSDGRSGDATHVLHFLLIEEGALDNYYSMDNDANMAKPNPAFLFGQFVYEGEIRVQVNDDK
jgi:hypothetical protein